MVKLKNSAAYMTAVKKIEIRYFDIPELRPGEVLLEMAYIGICGSDAHFYESGQRKGIDFALPFILGHEASGTVIAVAEGVTMLSVGDKVAIEPQVSCGICELCKTGRYNMCPDVVFPSTPPHDGMLRKYFAFPAHLCHKLPESVSLLEGALIEPFAVGLYATMRGGTSLGQTVVVIGMGTIGLMTVLAAKVMGASNIIAIDLFNNRLECAKEMGATAVVNSQDCDPIKTVTELTGSIMADVVFETAGSRATAAMTGKMLKRCGTIVLVGNVSGETPYEFMDLMYREGEIRTIYRYKNNFPLAISSVASGRVKLTPMVSEIYPFPQTNAAFLRAIEDKQHVVKIVIDMRAEGYSD